MNFQEERNGFGGFGRRNFPVSEPFKARERKEESGFAPKNKGNAAPIPGFGPKPKLNTMARATASAGRESDDLSSLTPGMKVEHEKFGAGTVVHVEGNPGEKKATVLFDTAGQKQLLLKFARLKIVSA